MTFFSENTPNSPSPIHIDCDSKNPTESKEENSSGVLLSSNAEGLKQDLRSRLEELEYKIWLTDLEIRSAEGKVLLYTSSRFKQEKISERYWGILQELTAHHFPGMALEWQSSLSPGTVATSEVFPESPPVVEEIRTKEISGNSPNRRILPENTFQNFLEIPENKLACRFVNQALEKPGAISPIYLYGSVGVGKTHLLHAFAHGYRERVPFAKIEYLTPDDFVSDFTRALLSKTDRNFRIHYRSLDALLIDDIQFFMGKEKSSQEFFHVFNAIHASKKQMIFTSDRDPRELECLDDRLKSRISSSAIIEIKSPVVTSRRLLIDFYVVREGLELPEEVKVFLSENLPSDIRQIVGAIRYLSALSGFSDEEPITPEYCQRHLKQLSISRTKTKYPPEKILYAVCERTGLSLNDLKSRKKSKQISRIRQSAMYLLRQSTELSLPEIGFALGGRTISAVTYGVEKTEMELSGSRGEALKQELDEIMEKASASSVF